MIVSKAVLFALSLAAILNSVAGKPQPSIIRERHIIHAPIKFRVIHHYKVKKVPIIIKKHLHYHKRHPQELHQPLLHEIQANDLYQHDTPDFHHQDDAKQPSLTQHHTHLPSTADTALPPQDHPQPYSFHLDSSPQDHSHELSPTAPHDSQEDDYEDEQQSQEDYDDSDYN